MSLLTNALLLWLLSGQTLSLEQEPDRLFIQQEEAEEEKQTKLKAGCGKRRNCVGFQMCLWNWLVHPVSLF
jgi:hypothetical protein